MNKLHCASPQVVDSISAWSRSAGFPALEKLGDHFTQLFPNRSLTIETAETVDDFLMIRVTAGDNLLAKEFGLLKDGSLYYDPPAGWGGIPDL